MAEHYKQIHQAAEDGIIIRVVSSFRKKEYQQSLFDMYYAQDQLYALKYSALPRRSL